MNKIKEIIIGILLIGLGILYFSFQSTVSRYDKQISDLKEEKKIELKEEKKKIIIKRDSLIQLKIKKYDSLLSEKQTIEYIPYEKPIYVDRTLDDAIYVLSNYSYQGTTKKD